MNAVDDEPVEESNVIEYRTNSEIPVVTAMLLGFQVDVLKLLINFYSIYHGVYCWYSCYAGMCSLCLTKTIALTWLRISAVPERRNIFKKPVNFLNLDCQRSHDFVASTVELRLFVLQDPAFASIPPLYAFARQPGMECQWKSTDYVPGEEYTGRLTMIRIFVSFSCH
ncbi:hypothetical protein M3Y98_00247900 [Aphelenchoides besseyi]|nr:hypothetical protein M3Y98_00247900 [Aphelenchoides besseyi]KAI6200739.1 hypothetical protein M3Y96_00766100 [Aphelenchoides besseyi]